MRAVYLERWTGDTLTITGGTGLILTEDGYLLTAAHCLSADPHQAQFIAFSTDPTGLELMRLRRVWVGDAGRADRDWAVVKVDRTTLTPALWCRDSDMNVGSYVVAAGSHETTRDDYLTVYAGLLRDAPLAATSTAGPAATRVVHITGPIGPGDSGGPVMTVAGNFVGIARGLDGAVVDVVRPSPDWVNQLIRDDRRTHPATRPAGFRLTIRRNGGPERR